MKKPFKNIFVFHKIIFKILTSFEFITIFLSAQAIIWFFAFLFYKAENGINPEVQDYFDALWWSYSTITTVGYGDIIPETFIGRIIGMFAMVIGTGIFITFLGVFTDLLLSNENILEIELFKKRIKKD